MKYIMLIDDSVTIRAIAELVLKNRGYTIRHAENGEDALAKICNIKESGDEIALCITDINMPVMGGIRFIQEFKKSDNITPILLLGSEADDSLSHSFEEIGASGFIFKPFSPNELLKKVNSLIKC